MIAYKFLRRGRLGPFTGHRWQERQWVEAGAVRVCDSGIHACRVEQLPFWINQELWEIELDGQIVEAGQKVVGERGRLLRPVVTWDEAAAQRLAGGCAVRARRLADAQPEDQLLRMIAEDCAVRASQGRANVATFIAAVAAEQAGGQAGRAAERAAQAAWFGELLA
jgi:hypothetical protein